jgi:hypothetical protein
MLLSEIVSGKGDAPVLVLFGGNPHRRDEVIRLVKSIGDITIYGVLSEEEGMGKIQNLPKVDLVLIGGRYTEEQRIRIRAYVQQEMKHTKVTEPGVDYPYENNAIKADIKSKLGIL